MTDKKNVSQRLFLGKKEPCNMGFLFSVVSSYYPLRSETNTQKQDEQFWKIQSPWMINIWHCKYFHTYSKIEVLPNCSAFLVSVLLVRGKYEGMRENKKHIFRAWNPTTVIPLLKAKNVFNGIWYQTLCRTSLVQCGRILRQK